MKTLPSRLFAALLLFAAVVTSVAQTNVPVRFMSANITSGIFQRYEAPGLRIFQGLKPDVVAIQEFNYTSTNGLGTDTPAAFREMLDAAFGTNFVYFRESGYSIPNGIISRWPIVDGGSWDDLLVGDRGFAWARIDLPGTNDLYVVSVHLYGSGTASDRNAEAAAIKDLIQTNFPANAWVIVAGDFNTGSRGEAAMTTFKTFLSDSPIPTDQGGDPDTNEPRNNPYDYVLPDFSLTNFLTATVLPSHTFANGLVFDSELYTPLSDVAPVNSGDSHTTNMQHMAVIKDFLINDAGPAPSTNPPSITAPPQNQAVTVGGNASFSVTATGASPLSYQWWFNTTNLVGGNTNTHSISNVQSTDAGNYSVTVTNSFGSITSSPAVLTVLSTGVTVIAQWNFNSAVPDTNTATGTTSPSFGGGTASLVGGTTATFATGDTSLDPVGSTDNSGWNTTTYPAQATGNRTRGTQFKVSTAGRENIVVTWSSRASDTGSKYGRLQYTIDGITFIDFPTGITNPPSFTPKTNSLAAIAGVNDNTNFAFRVVTEFEASAIGNGNSNYVANTTYGTGGTVRFDMVTVLGSAIPPTNPPPAAAVLSGPAFNTGQFQMLVTGSTGVNYIVQAATNLSASNWNSIFTNASPFTFTDSNASVFPQRFYRAVALP